jgi:hypothetical protein
VIANGIPETRIVIPFATWMDVRVDSLVGQSALVNRNSCNHLLIGDEARPSVAVNFEVWNDRPDQQNKRAISSWLSRGTIDHMRSCDEKYPISQLPIVQPYTFGNAYHDSNVPVPSVPTRFEACVGAEEVLSKRDSGAIQNLPCWKNVYRERSLGSPDWAIEIDALGPKGDNGWIVAKYGPGEQRPIIRDVQLAFRYTDRGHSTAKFECVR